MASNATAGMLAIVFKTLDFRISCFESIFLTSESGESVLRIRNDQADTGQATQKAFKIR